MTVFGKYQFNRIALLPSTATDAENLSRLKSEKMVFPFDEALGLDKLPFKLSVSAMLEIAYWVQEVPSFDAAGRVLKRCTPIRVNNETIRTVAEHVGSIVFKNDVAKANEAWEMYKSGRLPDPKVKKDFDFYIEVDGAMLHTRQKRDDKENKKEEAKSVWMENKLGMVFTSENFKRWKDRKGKIQQKIGKREYIAYLGGAEEFKKHLLALAIRNGYGKYRQTILLSDGATWIRHMKDEIFYGAQQILDFWHLTENIGEFAKSVFDLDEAKYKPWAERMSGLMRESRPMEVLGEIEGLGKRRLSKSKFDLAGYIKNNLDNIDYAAYLKNGWYIGSGAIESANRSVLQMRLKQPGMRWNQDSGQYILTLMSKAKSDLWGRDVEQAIRNMYETNGVSDILGHALHQSAPIFNL
jgi:hypothetical protein